MTSIRARVEDVLARTLKVDPSVIEGNLTVGDIPAWDSLGHVTVLQALEEEFGLTLDIDDALSIESVDDMVAVISRLTEPSGESVTR